MKLKDFVLFLFFQVPSGIQLYIMFFILNFFCLIFKVGDTLSQKSLLGRKILCFGSTDLAMRIPNFRRGEFFFDPLLFRGWMTMLYKDI